MNVKYSRWFDGRCGEFAGRFIALELLHAGDDELHVLISSQKLYFVGRSYDVVLLVPFDELLHCQCIGRGQSLILSSVFSLIIVRSKTTIIACLLENEQSFLCASY